MAHDTSDKTPVKVNLDRQRPYRKEHSDKDAVWVGPGEAIVPKWVAQAWGVEFEEAHATEDTKQAPRRTTKRTGETKQDSTEA